MANTTPMPDPYQGWRAMDRGENYTAHQLMTDTSGQWVCTVYSPFYRRYEQVQQ